MVFMGASRTLNMRSLCRIKDGVTKHLTISRYSMYLFPLRTRDSSRPQEPCYWGYNNICNRRAVLMQEHYSAPSWLHPCLEDASRYLPGSTVLHFEETPVGVCLVISTAHRVVLGRTYSCTTAVLEPRETAL